MSGKVYSGKRRIIIIIHEHIDHIFDTKHLQQNVSIMQSSTERFHLKFRDQFPWTVVMDSVSRGSYTK